jgi:hypothetical protein
MVRGGEYPLSDGVVNTVPIGAGIRVPPLCPGSVGRIEIR